MSVVLHLSNITKRFGSLTANDNISLRLEKGRILALLGENGAGKTTLMNILFGHYTADVGEIEAFGMALEPGSPGAALDAGIGMVHQHFSLAENLTVLENIMLGTERLWSFRMKRREARAKLLRLSNDFGLKVDPNALVGQLSIGEQQRVEILKALYRDSRILILDEPTAVLTPQEADQLFDTLKQLVDRGLSVIFITHKLKDVLRISDDIIVLRNGASVMECQTASADEDSLAQAMVGHQVAEAKAEAMEAGKEVLALENIRIAPEDGRSGLVVDTCILRAHRIIGIAGVSGNGQAAFANLLSGSAVPEAGEFRVHGEKVNKFGERHMIAANIGRIPEDRNSMGVIGEMSIAENMISERRGEAPYATRGIFDFAAIDGRVKDLIGEYDIRCPGPNAETRLLSGGNVQKLVLARVLSNDPDIILANQPVRGLDIGAISFVHNKLLEMRAKGAGIILISEDLDELLSLSDEIAVMYDGRLGAPMPAEDLDIRQLGLMMTGSATDGGA